MVGKKRAGSELPSATGMLSVLWHVALAGMFVANRLDYAALRDGTSASHRSLLGDAHVPTAELRKEMREVMACIGQLIEKADH
eukprot:COSAG04_NODE_2368_length_4261_cov_1.578087_5_plen_83_part_00